MTERNGDDRRRRLERARTSLEGLSLGDAFGERFFIPHSLAEDWIARRRLPGPPWRYTDDTAMALCIVEVLERHGEVDQDDLALTFARGYAEDPARGYGAGAHGILQQIGRGRPWQAESRAAFGGLGSFGNGGAMRVAPVGAYFCDDFEAAARNARLSAEVTHFHPEGQAGAVAIAVAAAWACCSRERPEPGTGRELFEVVLEHTPDSDTREGIARARTLSHESGVGVAVRLLGNGSQISAPDTVPFALWCAARHTDDFCEALWSTVSGLGDRDTTCAMVGGIVASAVGRDALPSAWLAAREALP